MRSREETSMILGLHHLRHGTHTYRETGLRKGAYLDLIISPCSVKGFEEVGGSTWILVSTYLCSHFLCQNRAKWAILTPKRPRSFVVKNLGITGRLLRVGGCQPPSYDMNITIESRNLADIAEERCRTRYRSAQFKVAFWRP